MSTSIKTIGVLGLTNHTVSCHLRFFLGDDVRVVGICDQSPSSRELASKVLGYAPPMFETPEALFEMAKPDVVLIGSPPQDRPGCLKLAVETGVAALVETPVAVDNAGLRVVQRALQTDGHSPVISCLPRNGGASDLPYGWARYHLGGLECVFGRLWGVTLKTSYPKLRRGLERNGNLLEDKFTHDIDYLRWLLANPLSCKLWAKLNAQDQYEVIGSLIRSSERHRADVVEIQCAGTRRCDSGERYILLNFDHGECLIYPDEGVVHCHNRVTGLWDEQQIASIRGEGRVKVYEDLTRRFLNGGYPGSDDDLLTNVAAAIRLAGPDAYYGGKR